MKRKIVITLLILICFLLQSTVFVYWDFGGIVPNILIILTASFGFMRGEKTGMIVGFFCGLLNDIFFGSAIGLYALIYMYIGYTNGKFSKVFFPQDIKLPLALIVLSDFAYGIIYYCLLFLLRGRFDFPYYLIHIIIPEVVYTTVVTLFFYPLFLWINNRLESGEKRSAKKFV